MAQLNFHANIPFGELNAAINLSEAFVSFFPIHPSDSISWKVANVMVSFAASKTFSLGLYSLNASTLSLANYVSGTRTATQAGGYLSLAATSSAQNITPGTWWLGFLFRTGGTSNLAIYYSNLIGAPVNAFPGGFLQGFMTATTTALPASYATSDLDITGLEIARHPRIILTA